MNATCRQRVPRSGHSAAESPGLHAISIRPMSSAPPSRCWLPPAQGAGTGMGLGLALLVLLSCLTVDVSVGYASCGHYVRDRLNPHAGHATPELPAWATVSLGGKWGIWRLPIDVTIVSGAVTPWGPAGPEWPVTPCQGPSCRAPLLPSAPSGLGTAVASADDSQSAATPSQTTAHSTRPNRPRGPRPQSELLPSSLSLGLFKPPC